MYHIIVNPQGGKGKSLKALTTVEEIFKNNNAQYVVHKTEYAGHATEIARELSKTPDTNIVVMGGDGSFHEVLCGIDNFDNVTLGLVACGSGNDFIKKSGHSTNVKEAVQTILNGKVGFVDYMELGKYRCLNVGGGGMDVDVLLKYANCKTLKGKAAYYYSLFYTLLHTRFHHLRITADGVTKDTSVFMIGVGNGGFIGGGIPICPNAIVDDGLLNVGYVSEMKRAKSFSACSSSSKASTSARIGAENTPQRRLLSKRLTTAVSSLTVKSSKTPNSTSRLFTTNSKCSDN